jgi:hypothetical protein
MSVPGLVMDIYRARVPVSALAPNPTQLLPTMDRLSVLSLSRFNAVCPYLGRTKPRTLRSLSTANSTRYPSVSRLAVKATQCPVMGPVISLRSTKLAAGYASVAGTNSGASVADPEVHRLHEQKGIHLENATEADLDKCPHASAARHAAKVAADLSAAKNAATIKQESAAAAAAGCPFHAAAKPAAAAAPAPAAVKEEAKDKFNYESFYVSELDKKHKDASYRYFNNINRLAAKFPVAHTGDTKDEVEVWCANDYLGMGGNPVVLETMQYAFCRDVPKFVMLIKPFLVALLIGTDTAPEALATLLETRPGISASRPSSPLCTARKPPSSFRPATLPMTPPCPPSARSSPAASTSRTR